VEKGVLQHDENAMRCITRDWLSILKERDEMARTIARHYLHGDDYSVPPTVKYLFVFICTPAPVYFPPSAETKLATVSDISRVLTPDELIKVLNAVSTAHLCGHPSLVEVQHNL
jgi:hypothetical protein